MRSLLFLFVEAWSGVSPTAELGEGDGGGDGDVEALGGGDAGGERGYEQGVDRKSTRLNSSHSDRSRMPSSA